MTNGNSLHLPGLTIEGFRGIDRLSIPRLGRVTLLTGKNSVGKTTVLDAVRVYAARGRFSSLYNLLLHRDEVFAETDEDGDKVVVPDWRALFHNRDASQDARVSIGSGSPSGQLVIKQIVSGDEQLDLFGQASEEARLQELSAEYGGDQETRPWIISIDAQSPFRVHRTTGGRRSRRVQQGLFEEGEPPAAIRYELLGPGLLNNVQLAQLWDGVALTDDEDRAVDALRMVFGSNVERVAVVGDDGAYRGRLGRRALAKLTGQNDPVPLRSLGDGAVRLFGVALALANSRDGFLLIDEAENGIHHTVQHDFWRMVLLTAQANNIQVLATTHSSDCVKGFARAARETEKVEGVLVRLSRQYDDLRAVEYLEEELAIAADQGIEVR